MEEDLLHCGTKLILRSFIEAFRVKASHCPERGEGSGWLVRGMEEPRDSQANPRDGSASGEAEG